MDKFLSLNDEQKAAVDKAKALPKGKPGRPVKEFGPVIKMAASVLRDAGLTIQEIADELHINPKTVQLALRDRTIKIETSDMNKVRDGFATHIAQIINKMLCAANTDEYVSRLQQTKNPGLVIGLATLIDKLNLLTGKATSIVETKDMVDSVQKQLAELEALQKSLEQSIVLPKTPEDN